MALPEIKIKLDLQDHCIETEIKKVYNHRVSVSLKQGLTDELEREIEGLKAALETFDFGKLRSHHRQLAGGANQWAILKIGLNGVPDIELPGGEHNLGHDTL
jgi:hypothetical protein